MIVLSQNTQLGLAEYELLRNSHAISQHPRVGTRFSLDVGSERAEAGRDGRACLATGKFSGVTGDRENTSFPVQLHQTTRTIGNHSVVNAHACINT